MKKLFLIPLEPIIGGEGKHILPHPSKTDNIFKYLDIIDLLSSVAQISTEITNQICYLTENDFPENVPISFIWEPCSCRVINNK